VPYNVCRRRLLNTAKVLREGTQSHFPGFESARVVRPKVSMPAVLVT